MLIVWFFAYKKLAQFAVRYALPPRRSESPVCATDNKPSCVLHLLGWFIGSSGFSSLERRPEFWVLHSNVQICKVPCLVNRGICKKVCQYPFSRLAIPSSCQRVIMCDQNFCASFVIIYFSAVPFLYWMNSPIPLLKNYRQESPTINFTSEIAQNIRRK